MAKMQKYKAPVEWPQSKGGDPTEGSLLGRCYGNRRQTNELKEKRAPSSVRGRGFGAWHFAILGKIKSVRAEGLAEAKVN